MTVIFSSGFHHTPIFATFNKAEKKQVTTIEKIRNDAGEVYAVMSYGPNKNYLLMNGLAILWRQK